MPNGMLLSALGLLLAASMLGVPDLSDLAADEMPGVTDQIGGALGAISAGADHVYLGAGPRVLVVDMTDPSVPRLVGQSAPLAGLVQSLAARGSVVYAATASMLAAPPYDLKRETPIVDEEDPGSRLYAIDVAEAAAPRIIGSIPANGWAYRVAADERTAVLGSWTAAGGLIEVVDIMGDGKPVAVGSSPTVAPVDLVLVGHYAYVLGRRDDRSMALDVIDVSSPASPVVVGSVDTPHTWATSSFAGVGLGAVEYSDGYVYVVGTAGIAVVDVTLPDRPQLISSERLSAPMPMDIVIASGYAFVAHFLTLSVVDISSFVAPRVIADLSLPYEAAEMAVFGSSLLVTHPCSPMQVSSSGVEIFDVSKPYDISSTAQWVYPSTVFDVAMADDTVFIAEGCALVSTMRVGGSDLSYGLHSHAFFAPLLRSLAISDDTLYLAQGDSDPDFLLVARVLAQDHLEALGALRHELPAVLDLAAAGDYVYIAVRRHNPRLPAETLSVVDATDPTRPTVIRRIATPGEGLGIAVRDNQAFLAAGDGGLRVIDVAVPAAAHETGYIDAQGIAVAVAVDGDWVYLLDAASDAESQGLLRVIDASDPSRPIDVAATPLRSAYPRAVAAGGNSIIVADGAEVRTFVLSGDKRLIEIGSVRLASDAVALAVAGEWIFVAAQDAGLYTLRRAGASYRALHLPLVRR